MLPCCGSISLPSITRCACGMPTESSKWHVTLFNTTCFTCSSWSTRVSSACSSITTTFQERIRDQKRQETMRETISVYAGLLPHGCSPRGQPLRWAIRKTQHVTTSSLHSHHVTRWRNAGWDTIYIGPSVLHLSRGAVHKSGTHAWRSHLQSRECLACNTSRHP